MIVFLLIFSGLARCKAISNWTPLFLEIFCWKKDLASLSTNKTPLHTSHKYFIQVFLSLSVMVLLTCWLSSFVFSSALTDPRECVGTLSIPFFFSYLIVSRPRIYRKRWQNLTWVFNKYLLLSCKHLSNSVDEYVVGKPSAMVQYFILCQGSRWLRRFLPI